MLRLQHGLTIVILFYLIFFLTNNFIDSQLIQNSAARIVTHSYLFYNYIGFLFVIVSIAKIFLLNNKTLHNLAPLYLEDILQLYTL